MQPYKHYTAFEVGHPADGVLRLTIDTGHKNNGINHANHHEFGDVWRDVAIAADNAQIIDGHVMAGLACGDHAAYWPLMMGMPRAKYHLLTARPMSGVQAREAGLVALSVTADALHSTALETATHIATMPAEAVRLTKRSLNSLYQLGHGAFEMSAAYEVMGFTGEAVRQFAAQALGRAR